MSLWTRLVRGSLRESSMADWREGAGSDYAQTIMHLPVTDHFHAKQGRSTGRVILSSERGPIPVYLKRHWQLPWRDRLLATLFPQHGWSPAAIEARHLRWAENHGIPVPEVLAEGEFVGPRFRLASFLVIRELTGLDELHKVIPHAAETLSPPRFAHWKRSLVAQLALTTRRLHDQHRFHRDLYLCHFFARVPNRLEAHVGQVHLIDLHRLRRHRWLASYFQIKDLAQLLFSSWDVAGITDVDRWRFLRLYLQKRKLSRWHRLLTWAVRRKARRYAKHQPAVSLGTQPLHKAA